MSFSFGSPMTKVSRLLLSMYNLLISNISHDRELPAAADVTNLSKAKRELSSAKHALLDLRALVDE